MNGQIDIELLFLDTKAGEDAGIAAITGIRSDVDIFIGPLFTDAVIEARAVMAEVANGHPHPPMLLLSNNVDMAAAISTLFDNKSIGGWGCPLATSAITARASITASVKSGPIKISTSLLIPVIAAIPASSPAFVSRKSNSMSIWPFIHKAINARE